jgi:hypothetical protein
MNKRQIEPAAVVGVDDIDAGECLQYAIGSGIPADQLDKLGIISTTEINADDGDVAARRGKAGGLNI